MVTFKSLKGVLVLHCFNATDPENLHRSGAYQRVATLTNEKVSQLVECAAAARRAAIPARQGAWARAPRMPRAPARPDNTCTRSNPDTDWRAPDA
ncbi:hypothetical protein RR48_15298 [Papilio machaon]|uniref:Uncharacterized protein n=1 Tax=Papilio machaon TaxID=76193 RepID=A0A194QUL2_PAPMA|nr:hypothetical protein RR48_15298 [Papilio machaon]